MSKVALISGCTGQDGSYLAELLLSKNYIVHGIKRRTSTINTQRIDHIFENENFHLHYADLSDGSTIRKVINTCKPDEIYHLAAMSQVRVSFDQPEYTGDIGALGTLRLLEAIRELDKPVRLYNASSSEMFGNEPPPQNEQTRLSPRSPYAIAKVAAHHYCVNYREAYNMFICNGILYNHESPRRGETFVTRKISRAVGRIKFGLQKELVLGNLEAKRDFGYAKEYVEFMWLMLQQPQPDDYVIATGETHSVREFLEEACLLLGLDHHNFVRIDPRYFRPTEVDVLLGDAKKAREKLGWAPKTSFKELVAIMVNSDMYLANKEYLTK
jgi:GDPmannose 4,6-dehydratase